MVENNVLINDEGGLETSNGNRPVKTYLCKSQGARFLIWKTLQLQVGESCNESISGNRVYWSSHTKNLNQVDDFKFK